jgi:hypothetical protein
MHTEPFGLKLFTFCLFVCLFVCFSILFSIHVLCIFLLFDSQKCRKFYKINCTYIAAKGKLYKSKVVSYSKYKIKVIITNKSVFIYISLYGAVMRAISLLASLTISYRGKKRLKPTRKFHYSAI